MLSKKSLEGDGISSKKFYFLKQLNLTQEYIHLLEIFSYLQKIGWLEIGNTIIIEGTKQSTSDEEEYYKRYRPLCKNKKQV